MKSQLSPIKDKFYPHLRVSNDRQFCTSSETPMDVILLHRLHYKNNATIYYTRWAQKHTHTHLSSEQKILAQESTRPELQKKITIPIPRYEI